MRGARHLAHAVGRLARLGGLTLAALAALSIFTAVAGRAAAEFEPLEIATQKGVVVLEVEVARTPETRSSGLMFRTSLPDRQGMLFDFEEDQPVFMWMKNTYIPLDMLFIRSDGTIARIAEMTTPLSTQTISSGEPVRAVLEIAGGAAAQLGIAPGDHVSHDLFGKTRH